jgi:hypothetical protein
MSRTSPIKDISVAVALVASLALAAPDARAEEAPPPVERHGSLFVDPLGLVMFGPRAGIEAGGSHVTVALTGRWFDAGLLSHALFLKQGDDFGFSWGAGLRGRYYADEGQSGLHGGAGAEVLHTRIETKADLIAAVSTYVIPSVEGGYRLARGRVYGDLAAAVGYAARASGHVENLPGGDRAATFQAQNKSSAYAAASLELGLFF